MQSIHAREALNIPNDDVKDDDDDDDDDSRADEVIDVQK